MAEATFEALVFEARAMLKNSSDLDSAKERFTKAKELASEDQNSLLIAETGLAEVAMQRKEWTGAAESIANALAAIEKGADDVKAIVRVRFINGICLMCLKKSDEAVKEFEFAKEKATEPLIAEIEKRIEQVKDNADEEELLKAALDFDSADAAVSRKRKASEANKETEANGGEADAEKKPREELAENGNSEEKAPATVTEGTVVESKEKAEENLAEETEKKPVEEDETQVHPDADMPLKDGKADEEPAKVKAKSVEDIQAAGDRVTSTA